ncbi:hypothetical protein ATI53_1001196 [Salipiger aestuarii]|uniref:Uncharacterized protein n=1 Tax=Salipiger aestuarii TaxID=568098 RepID=A0A327Z1I5_9RHOB|nr:hypothetical protein ATI53_1001196 [Salipiger aestuarii]
MPAATNTHARPVRACQAGVQALRHLARGALSLGRFPSSPEAGQLRASFCIPARRVIRASLLDLPPAPVVSGAFSGM